MLSAVSVVHTQCSKPWQTYLRALNKMKAQIPEEPNIQRTFSCSPKSIYRQQNYDRNPCLWWPRRTETLIHWPLQATMSSEKVCFETIDFSSLFFMSNFGQSKISRSRFFTFHLEPYSVFRNHSNKTGGPKHPKTVERSCPNFCATAWGKRQLSTSCQLPECFSWWQTPCRGSDSSYMAWGGLCDWGYAHSPRRTPSCCFGNTLPKRPATRSLETQAVIQKQKLSFWKPHDTLTYEICFCKTMSFWIHHKRWEVGWPKRGPHYYVWCGKK